MKPFVFKIGGQAGFGIASTGLTMDKIATRSGYYVFDYLEYPSIIRGGHNVVETIISDEPVLSPFQHTDFLIAFGQETIDRHYKELRPGSALMVDSDGKFDLEKISSRINIYKIPLNSIAREVGGSMLMRDMVALGAVLFFLEGSLTILFDLIEQEFKRKGDEVVKKNQAVAQHGFDYAAKHYVDKQRVVLTPCINPDRQIVITGNEAIALGAVAAGMQFASIYPMTPTSNILHVLAPLQEQYGFIYKQPEDEISAINMAIGAGFAGARSMVATAGGGFCLMAEGYSLAGMTETPVVIIEGMRGAPSTGLPTWTEQGDLRFMLHAGQGDFPRIVIAPGDAEEAFHVTMQAFNLAEKYQTPVVVLVDKHICESHQSFCRLLPVVIK
jgi:2-oxoglutarate ferredoxin oxidoreductase subunit alpha